MEKEQIDEIINYAIKQVKANDAVLIDLNVSERAIMFHLARYIREKTPIEFHVDCEYNRHLNEVKSLTYLKNKLGIEANYKVIPDILIHKRGSDDCNILVAELKKFGASPDDVASDKRRLNEFKGDSYSYMYAVQIILGNAQNEPVISYEFI